MTREVPACVEADCHRPAVWTVEVDHAERAGLDVQFCDQHAFVRVTRAARWSGGSSWGPVVRVELLRLWAPELSSTTAGQSAINAGSGTLGADEPMARCSLLSAKQSEVVAGLRAWAAGFAADEAAVQLLTAAAVEDGWVVEPRRAWILPCPRPGWWWLDGRQLHDHLYQARAALRPVLALVAALTVDGAAIELGLVLASLSTAWLGAVLSALAHAAGIGEVQLLPSLGVPQPLDGPAGPRGAAA